MSSKKTVTFSLGGQEYILETGLLAVQASGAVTLRCGDTIVLATATRKVSANKLDYFPLMVEYREKLYAGGIIKSSRFVKREGRPSDDEILTSRLIDRSIRPLFSEDYRDEVQIMVTPLSIDGQHDPAILGCIAASAALSISEIPFEGPIACVRVGQVDGETIINPDVSVLAKSALDLVVSGTPEFICMVEAGAKEVDESAVLSGLTEAQKSFATITDAINDLSKQIGKDKLRLTSVPLDPAIIKLVEDHITDLDALVKDMSQREGAAGNQVITAIIEANPEVDATLIIAAVDHLVRNKVRSAILEKGVRPDGRTIEEVRPINIEIGLLPRTHGSAFFQRGLTHALSVLTLGSPGRELLIESMEGDSTKRYMHEYNMPPFASGETGRIGWPGRREIGHGALAEKALIPVIPSEDEFPYTIRVVTEIMSSNGSTSQASVCGSTLALMDAGVPIKKPVAGIAMGLITDGKDKFVTLTDIMGMEDHLGDMDFKVAGTADGITALQMDVKFKGITADLLGGALDQAKRGRMHILGKMLEAIAEPRKELSQYAPRIESVKIAVDKIGTVIGPGGKMIREIQTKTGAEIDIDDDGTVSISSPDAEAVAKAKAWVVSLTAEAEVGKIYTGKVARIE
ncbi:polyribonucleotide nucleotidyltransferase, partial [Candidatus Collierbacteria bacterium RIFOXYB1_FULL_49_13]